MLFNVLHAPQFILFHLLSKGTVVMNDNLNWDYYDQRVTFALTKIQKVFSIPNECDRSKGNKCITEAKVSQFVSTEVTAIEPPILTTGKCHVVKVFKSISQCQIDYKKRQQAIIQLLNAFKDYPKSFESLSSSFWKTFFEENDVSFNENDTILALDYSWEYKIQIMRQRFNDLEPEALCRVCGKKPACIGESHSCIDCINHDYPLGLSIANVNLNNLLSGMVDDKLIYMSTTSGVFPISINTYKEHHKITDPVIVRIFDTDVLVFNKNEKRLFYMHYDNEQDMVRFLSEQSGKTLIY